MKSLVLTLMFATFLSLLSAAHSPSKDGQEISLSEAISDFNKKSLNDPIGAKESPLTTEEVIAVILIWERSAGTLVSDELIASFKRIAETKSLPINAEFARLTGYDRGSHIFDVWSVRIRMKRADGTSYEFRIRERVVGSRTLSEEVARLAKFIDEENVESWVGGHRILERKKELEARIKKNAQ